MITEFVKYYEYTMEEVKYKIFGDATGGNRDVVPKHVKDENLTHLIDLYIKYKAKYHTISIIQFMLRYNNPFLSIAFKYKYFKSWYDDALIIEDESEFIDFINDPDLFKEIEKYNI